MNQIKNKALITLLLLPLSAAFASKPNSLVPGQAKLPNGRTLNYQFDPSSQSFGVDLNGLVNVKYITNPTLGVDEKGCEFWDDTISHLPSLRDAAGTLSVLPKPKSDISFSINFVDPYLTQSVMNAVATSLKQDGHFTSKLKNGTELTNLNASVILKWDNASLTKRGQNNLIADAESRFNYSVETNDNGSVYFKVNWDAVNQYIACDVFRKSVHFIVVYWGDNTLRYRTSPLLNTSAIKQVWFDVGSQATNQSDILLNGSQLTYRDAQWALVGAQLALASHRSQINSGESFSAKTFFTFLNAFFDPEKITARKDFENDVLPRVTQALSSEQKIQLSIFKGDKTL